MLAALISDSDGCVDVLLDMSNITASHNGTFQSAKQILIHAASAWKHWCKLHVRISPEALAFHQLDSVENVYFVPLDTNKRFAAAFHIGQPFKLTTIERMNFLGVLNYWVMLDTIAWDCQYLHQIDERLDSMWRYVCESSTGIFYISKFVRDQFQRRFRLGQHVQQKVVYLSLNPAEHCESATLNATESRHILVIGNHYEHKFLRPTVEALVASFPFEKIVVVGLPSHSAQRVIAYASGQLSDTQIDNLYASCKFLVYPSQYEGFGLPVMKALAYNKPIVARSLPTTKELAEALDAGTNIRFYDTTQDLIHILRNEDLHWSNMPEKWPAGGKPM